MNMPSDIKPEYDRVTTVLYPFSGLHKLDVEIVRRAAHRGSIVHQACDCIISDLPLDEIDESYKGYLKSFMLWHENRNFLHKPERWYDDELMITGECDGLYEKDGEITLFDLKTPLREGSTWGMQGAAYAYLAKQSGTKVDKVEFIRLKKDGSYPSIYIYPLMLDDFLTCLTVYRKYFKNTPSENFDY